MKTDKLQQAGNSSVETESKKTKTTVPGPGSKRTVGNIKAADPVMSATDVNVYYGDKQAIRNISLEIGKNEVVAMIGPSGCGKTTLLRSIIGALLPTQGSIHFNGTDVSRMAPNQRAKVGMAYVPQGREIFNRLTVEDNLRMGLATQPGGTPIPPELFELFPVLKQMLHRRGGDLSGGQQQQLAIARALAAKPQLLLADEPTAALDSQSGREVVDLLKDLARQQGCGVLMVTHDPRILDIADRLLQMEDGHLFAKPL